MRHAVTAALLAALPACGKSGCAVRSAPDDLAIACGDAERDMGSAPASLPPIDDAHRGDVVRCGHVRRREAGLHGDTTTLGEPSGVSLIRLGYRTARAERAVRQDALAGALFILPEAVRDPDVLVVIAHGTVGFGGRCLPSRRQPSGLARRLANEGWMSILPDYAGFGYGGAPGWMHAEDEARSIFDAIRAVHRLLPEGRRPKRVILVGESQGGHAVLAAQALAHREALPVEIVGVAATAPMWFPPRLFARMITRDEKPVDAGERDLLWALYYFYGHAELEDGPGHGVSLLEPSIQGALAKALQSGCTVDVEEVLGDRAPSQVFAPRFLDELRACDEGGVCSPAAARWMQRFARDWPQLDPEGAPVLWLQGMRDANVTLPRVRCALDRMRTLAGAALATCGDPDGTHQGEIFKHLDDLSSWIAQRAEGKPGAVACDSDALRHAAESVSCPIDGAAATP